MTPSELVALATADTPGVARYVQANGGRRAVEAGLSMLAQDGDSESRLLIRAGVKRMVEVYLQGEVFGVRNALLLNVKALVDLGQEQLAQLAAAENLQARSGIGLQCAVDAPSIEALRLLLRSIVAVAGPFVDGVTQESLEADAVRDILGPAREQTEG